MPAIEYRIFFNNNPATREQLDRVEEITVEQEVDMAWEARIQIPIIVDEKGNWTGVDEDFMAPFSRARVEVRLGKGPFIPLIDGTIVETDSPMHSEPGQSSKTLNVYDDSVFLNREEEIRRFENFQDHEVARRIFGEFEQIASTDIEDTPPSGSSLPPIVVQRGTAMQILRSLARRQGKHVYVLPGESPGQSIGCFKAFPVETDGLPPLILLGSERNIENFNVRNNARRPANVRASIISILDKSVITRESRFSDIELLGEETAFESESDTATHILPPHQGESSDLDQAVRAEAANSSFAFDVTGKVLDLCYEGVLSPYRVVCIRGANNRLSGNYLITKVTHTLTRSTYSQSFTLRRNARSGGAGSGLAGPAELAGRIF
jgi:phage protein D